MQLRTSAVATGVSPSKLGLACPGHCQSKLLNARHMLYGRWMVWVKSLKQHDFILFLTCSLIWNDMGLSENRAAAKSSGYHYFFHMFPMENWLLLSIPHFQTNPFVQDDAPSQELVAGEGKGFWAGVSDAQFLVNHMTHAAHTADCTNPADSFFFGRLHAAWDFTFLEPSLLRQDPFSCLDMAMAAMDRYLYHF